MPAHEIVAGVEGYVRGVDNLSFCFASEFQKKKNYLII